MGKKVTVQETITEHPIVGSVYIEKRFNVNRVPSIEEVKTFLGLMRYGSRWHAFYSTAFFCGLRPIEICNLTTDMIICDGERWVGLTYPVGKPKPPGRPKKGEQPKKAIRKWNRIDERLGTIPPHALDSLRYYWLTERQHFGTLFPKAYKQYGKVFSQLRLKMVKNGFTNWEQTSQDYFRHLTTLQGKTLHEHDITPYSCRRFFVTCYYWLVSAQNRNGVPDLIETQKRMAHSGHKDTETYTYSWRELGINPESIGKGWEILAGKDTKQKRINEF